MDSDAWTLCAAVPKNPKDQWPGHDCAPDMDVAESRCNLDIVCTWSGDNLRLTSTGIQPKLRIDCSRCSCTLAWQSHPAQGEHLRTRHREGVRTWPLRTACESADFIRGHLQTLCPAGTVHQSRKKTQCMALTILCTCITCKIIHLT
jgi:hypothetical protein